MDSTFSKNVYEYITERGITQQRVAELLGLGWNATHAKLLGERPFTLQEAIVIAEWMDCSLDWLTGLNHHD